MQVKKKKTFSFFSFSSRFLLQRESKGLDVNSRSPLASIQVCHVNKARHI